ncbi:MAG TPA: ATP-binding protein [Stellaceae bacterium]|nr:ATP-binding protein [Stellaceae bacterium]
MSPPDARACATAPSHPRDADDAAPHLYREIFENCAWGVFQTTADGRYLTANPALARIYGYASAKELCASLTDIGGQLYVDPARRAAFVQIMGDHGVVTGFESQVRRRDGTVIWIAETCREVRAGDQLLYYEGTVEDISARKRSEAALLKATQDAEAAHRELRAANQDLERHVAERTAQLRAIQDELLRKERLSTLGKLTGSVAHELRNPLSAIRNSLHVVRGLDAARDAQLDRQIARIERCVARCDHIISDLIDYSHARKLNRRATRIDPWLAEFLDHHPLRPGIVVDRRLDAAGALVRLDHDRFRSAIIHLVDNAVQAMEELPADAERRLTIETRTTEWVRIIIADTGPGIAQEVMPQVFEPLFSTRSFGTGLGLPTVKQIVELHDGTIDIASTPGRGTSIALCLPRTPER